MILRALRFLRAFPPALWAALVQQLPGPLGHSLRRRFWKKRLRSLGRDVLIDVGAWFQNPGWVSLDDHCWIDRNVLVLAGPPGEERLTGRKENPDFPLREGEVYIGKHTHIAPNCVLSGMGGLYVGAHLTVAAGSAVYSFSHHYRNLVDRADHTQYAFTSLARPDQQAMVLGPVFIADYCAIGLNSVLLPGTSLGRGTWVACGTVVSGRHPAQSLIGSGGQPTTRSLAHLKIRE